MGSLFFNNRLRKHEFKLLFNNLNYYLNYKIQDTKEGF